MLLITALTLYNIFYCAITIIDNGVISFFLVKEPG